MLTLGADADLTGLAWRMSILGAAMALFNSPVMTALLSAAPPGEEGAAGGIANLARTLGGNTLGPAVAALAWTLSGGGEIGFRSTVLALTACTAIAFAVLPAARHRAAAAGKSPVPGRAD